MVIRREELDSVALVPLSPGELIVIFWFEGVGCGLEGGMDSVALVPLSPGQLAVCGF